MMKIKKSIYLILSLMISILLVSCGGSGGGEDSSAMVQENSIDQDDTQNIGVLPAQETNTPVVSAPVVIEPPSASTPVVDAPATTSPASISPEGNVPAVGLMGTSLLVDPQFNIARLPPEAQLWYRRSWAAIKNPSQMPLDVDEMAQSNDTYLYARALNTHVTTLMQMLRVTGDPALLAEIDRIAEMMRAQLKDWSITKYNGTVYEADGYLNWQYFYDAGYIGTDVHQMDEQLSHSLVAAMAYAFHVNRDLDPRYAERATFWTNYLKNHFEAKWRKRTGIATGFPFLTKKLAHVHIQWIRYHYYMYQLTGEKAYLDEAVRMAGIMDQHITETSTPYGVAAQWYHGMPILGEETLGIQRMSYARYTVQAAADLALEGFNVFASPGFMEKMSVMLSYFVMDAGAPSSFAYLIDGTSDPRETDDRYSYSPYTQLGYWDPTGRVLNISEAVYRQLEGSPEQPQRLFIPAGIFFSLMR